MPVPLAVPLPVPTPSRQTAGSSDREALVTVAAGVGVGEGVRVREARPAALTHQPVSSNTLVRSQGADSSFNQGGGFILVFSTGTGGSSLSIPKAKVGGIGDTRNW